MTHACIEKGEVRKTFVWPCYCVTFSAEVAVMLRYTAGMARKIHQTCYTLYVGGVCNTIIGILLHYFVYTKLHSL